MKKRKENKYLITLENNMIRTTQLSGADPEPCLVYVPFQTVLGSATLPITPSHEKSQSHCQLHLYKKASISSPITPSHEKYQSHCQLHFAWKVPFSSPITPSRDKRPSHCQLHLRMISLVQIAKIYYSIKKAHSHCE
jgi:hypothetical protein